MKVSFVIPCFDKFHLTSQVLMDVYQNCRSVDEVLVVDNGGKEEATRSGFQFWQKHKEFPLKVLRLEENVGFIRASNYGLKEATGDIVALISNDVRVHKDLAEISKEIIKPADKILLGGKAFRDTTGWNEFGNQIFPYVEGWVLITTKEGWEDLGYLDERFCPNDYEDVDLSTTAINKGYEIKQFPPYHGVVVEHIGAQTISYGDERMALTLRNKEKFREKWLS